MNKKFLISGLLVAAVAIFLLYEKVYKGNQTPVANNNQQQPTSSEQNNQQGAFKDGEYTGKIADAFYGKMQVKAIISGGKLTDVQFLQYPNRPGLTTELSNKSLPQLKSEAIQTQSPRVDIITGATQTSQAFMQSLQSALVMAGSTDSTTIEVTPPGGLSQ